MKADFIDGKLIIRLDDILDNLTLEEKHELATKLVWDKEIFNDVIDSLANDSVVTTTYNSLIYDARLRLIELLPTMSKEIIRSLLHELAVAKEDKARHSHWAWELYHRWPSGEPRPPMPPFIAASIVSDKELSAYIESVEVEEKKRLGNA